MRLHFSTPQRFRRRGSGGSGARIGLFLGATLLLTTPASALAIPRPSEPASAPQVDTAISAAEPASATFRLRQRLDRDVLLLQSASLRDLQTSFRFKLDRVPTVDTLTLSVLLRRSDAGEYRLRLSVSDTGRVRASFVRRLGGSVVELTKPRVLSGLRVGAGTWVSVAVRVAGTAPTTLSAKVWRTAGPTPSTPMLTGSDPSGRVQGPGGVGTEVRLRRALQRALTITVEDLRASAPVAATGPSISDVRATDITKTAAQIAWSLDEAATGQVEYGLDTSYGSWTKRESSFAYSKHLQALSGLTPDTVYHYRVISTNSAGGTTRSGDRTFRTKAGDTPTPTPPPADPVGIVVPASIDRTGSSNVSGAMQNFVNGVPDGSTIVFPAGATYLLSGDGLFLRRRSGLTLTGEGATLKSLGCDSEDSLIRVEGGSGIVIRGLTLVGDNDVAGTSNAYTGGCEHQHGIAVSAASDVEIDQVTIRRVHGDCLYLGRDTQGTWASDVRFHDSTCTLTGRQGVAIVAAKKVRVARVEFDKIAINVLDIEPNTGADGATDITLTSNTVGSYSHSSRFRGFFFGANGSLDAMVRGVVVSDNTVTGGGLDSLIGDEHTGFSGQRNRRSFTFTGNVSTATGAWGPVVTFLHTDGVTVSGNRQTLRGGTLARFVDSTGVTYNP